tara:strand:- start:599 stop:1240 length:642 start_codon:yes stop_codon:yes gene_type:complete
MDIKQQILEALGLTTEAKVSLEYQNKLEDGTIIVSTGDALVEGADISILTEDGTTIPLPVGSYKTEDGIGFTVEEEGKVSSMVEEEVETEEEIDDLGDEEEYMEEEVRQPKKIKETKEMDFNKEEFIAEVSDVFKTILSEINEKVSNLTAEVEELKSAKAEKEVELSKTPATEPLNTNKFSKQTVIQELSKTEYQNLSSKERYWYNLSLRTNN